MFLTLIFDNDGQVVAVVYEKHCGTMLYTSRKFLGDARAEEALHDVFVRLIEKNKKNISDLRDKPAFYFVVMMRNHCIDLLRRENGETLPLDEDVLSSPEPTPEEIAIDSDAEARLVALIRSMNPTAREILEYRYILGYSNKEIAKELGLTESVVSSRLDRAKKVLRKKLEEGEQENANK